MLQCRNVSQAVHRPYSVIYGPVGMNAWEAGGLCKDVGDLCTDVDGPLKNAGDCSVSGLVFAGLGQAFLLVYSMRPKKTNMLWASEACFAVAWILLLASWAIFARVSSQDATCIVEAESKTGAVIASGQFSDIVNGRGSYTFGFVIGAWLLLLPTMTLIGLRLKDVVKGEQVIVSKEAAGEPAKVEASTGKPDDMEEI
jgi:hypothetical protein